jgi:tRNA dimethylallyltransferase
MSPGDTPDAPPPIVIGGPTASGKSALALALAERLGGELVCADSRQVYAGMAIAAAGPTDEERRRAPHHLYGEVDPAATMTAGAWASRADALIAAIGARGRVPLLVGGTGLYLRAWRVGLEEPGDGAVRARLEDEADRHGIDALHARLGRVDAKAAAAIAPTDRMRIVRALEIFEVSGRPRGAVDLSARPPRPIAAQARWLLVDAPLEVLEPRIRARAEQMFAAGIVDEARALRERLAGVETAARLLETLGVKEALAVADGALGLEEAITRTSLRTRQYARRQRTWFKKEAFWQRLDTAWIAAGLAAPRPGQDRSVVDEVLSLLATPSKPG